MEKECFKHGLCDHFPQTERGRVRYRCKACNAEGVTRHRNKKKLWCVDYLGGRCTKCGYDKCIAALEFHHRNPSEKEFGFAVQQKRSYKRLAKELDKCDLLCANCHREVHGSCNPVVG